MIAFFLCVHFGVEVLDYVSKKKTNAFLFLIKKNLIIGRAERKATSTITYSSRLEIYDSAGALANQAYLLYAVVALISLFAF